MKIKRFEVEYLDSGAALVFTVAVVEPDELPGFMSRLISPPVVIEGSSSPLAVAAATPEPQPEQTEVRRRRANTSDPAPDAGAQASAATSASAAPTQPAEEPRRRRRSEDNPTEAAASTTSAKVEGAPAAETSASSSEGNGRRRRGGDVSNAEAPLASSGGAQTANAVSGSDLTDLELSKLASQASVKITPAKVKDVIASFGVPNISALSEFQRPVFKATLETAMKAA